MSKTNKTLIYRTTIEGIDFNVYSASISNRRCLMLAFRNDEVQAINITINRFIDHRFYDQYFKARLSTYQAIIEEMAQKNKHMKKWEESATFNYFYDRYDEWNRQKLIENERAKQEDRLPDKYEIEATVKEERGYHFTRTFYCRLCSIKHSSGYTYLIRGHEVDVCTYCRTDIRRTNNYVKIIPTNMGHGKRG